MNREVNIEITAIHGSGPDRDVIKTKAEGIYSEKDTKQYLKYKEEDPENGSVRDALIKIEGRSVTAIYRGNTETTMIFEVGQTNRSMYVTPMGSMQLEIETKKDSFGLSIEYRLGIAGGEKQTVALRIKATPKD